MSMPSNPLPAKYGTLNAMEFSDEAKRVLVKILTTAFPHKNFPPGPYERMADQLITMADESPWFRMKLIQGVETIDASADRKFSELSYEDAVAALKKVERTEFFSFIRRMTILTMYEDEEVWSSVGYEGPSFDKGGYIDRGFNDLDWLPEPRIEESEEPQPDFGPGHKEGVS